MHLNRWHIKEKHQESKEERRKDIYVRKGNNA